MGGGRENWGWYVKGKKVKFKIKGKQNNDKGPGMAAPAIKCSTQEKEAGKSLCLGQLGLCKKDSVINNNNNRDIK